MSELTIIPDGWQKRSLISLADYVNGYSFGPSDWAEDGRLIIKIEQLNNPNAKGARFSGDISPAYHIVNGDLIFSWSATLKAEFWRGEPGVLNQHLFKVIPSSDVNMQLLQKLLEFYMDELAAGSQGSTMKHITRAELIKFHVALPVDKDEQQKIAKILSTVDSLIEKTQTLIDKYTAIKQGMMADLFTRGIDMTTGDTLNSKSGKLRPSVEDAPELYKQTELGWVPKEWEVLPCDSLCERICVGIVIQPTQYYATEGVPAFRSANVREDGVDPKNFVYISEESNNLLAKSQIKTGDVLSVRTGYPGTSAVVPKEFSGCNSIDILISTPNKSVLSKYLCEWINSDYGKGQVLKMQGGIAQQHFNVGDMKELLVGVPCKSEQQRIVERFDAIKNKIQIEKDVFHKYSEQKKGLMQDLLTGKVKV